MVGLRGGVGEGLRSVGVAPTSPIQERVLYPAHRSTFRGRGILRGPGPFIWSIGWSIGAKEGRPHPLHIRQPTLFSSAHIATWVDLNPPCTYQITSSSLCTNHSFAVGAFAFLGATI